MKIIQYKGRIFGLKIVQDDNGIYEYQLDGEKIGVFDPNVMDRDQIILTRTLEEELQDQIKEVINNMNLEEIDKEAELGKYAKSIGEKEERLIRIVELKEVKGKEQKGSGEKERKKEEKETQTQKDENLRTKENEINIKQELDADTRLNEMKRLNQWIGLSGDYTKVCVIESLDRNELKNEKGESYERTTSRYSLVAINKQGEVIPLEEAVPQLEQRDSAGNNPTRQEYQVEEDGEVEKSSVLTQFQVGDKTLSIENGKYGEIEVFSGQESVSSTEGVQVQLETDNVWTTDVENREVLGEYERSGRYTPDQGIEEAEKHKGEKIEREDIDGDMDTTSHFHVGMDANEQIPNTDTTWQELANECHDTVENVQRLFDQKLKNNSVSKENSDIVDEIIDDVNLEMTDPMGRKR